MLQKPCKTLDFKKNMVYEIPPGGGGVNHIQPVAYNIYTRQIKKRTSTIFPFRSPFKTKMLIVMKYSFLIKSYSN